MLTLYDAVQATPTYLAKWNCMQAMNSICRVLVVGHPDFQTTHYIITAVNNILLGSSKLALVLEELDDLEDLEDLDKVLPIQAVKLLNTPVDR